MAPNTLVELEEQLRRDLGLLAYPQRDWVLPRSTREGGHIYDVVIVGAGQSGLSTAFGLMRERVSNLLVVDKNPPGREGPWRRFARMLTLRTPKYLTGPDWGIPGLTFQSWYEAQHGAAAWASIKLIPKELWADYLAWYRRFLAIPVRNETTAGNLHYREDLRAFEVPLETGGESTILFARKVVLATGIEGSGEWRIPSFITSQLPKSLYAHTEEDIDFAALAGKRIGVLGAGASAFDNASTALEAGALEAHLFFRREKMVDINPYRWAEFVGFLKHHSDLPDAQRWKFILQILRMGQLPPADTWARARATGRFHTHPGATWDKLERLESGVRVTTAQGAFDLDYLIIGTGFATDLALRPELQSLHPHIALWSDRYRPPPELESADLGRHPYLGANFEFLEKTPGEAPYLKGVFNYTFGCLASMGFGGASISGLKYSLPKVVNGITRQLYLEDQEAYFTSLETYDAKEF